jgi:hypothetical protein
MIQSYETDKYCHGSYGAWHQELLCYQGPAEKYHTSLVAGGNYTSNKYVKILQTAKVRNMLLFIPESFDDGVEQSESHGFWTLPIVRNSK